MTDTAHQQKFHRSYHNPRMKMLSNLREPDHSLCTRIADKIGKCGSGAALFKDEDGFLVVATARCKSRLCPTCQESRSKRTWARVKSVVDLIDQIRFLTLTIRSSNKPLHDQIKDLRAGWNKLRKRKDIRNRIKGGIVVIEITHNAKTDQWHPHLHVIFEGLYIKQGIIAKNWREITNDSEVVDIRLLHSRIKAVNYIAKYVSKTSQIPKTADHRLVEWVEAVAGLREYTTFGTMHNQIAKQEKLNRELQHVMYMNQLAEGARDNHEGCEAAYQRIINLPKKTEDEEENKLIKNQHTAAWNYAVDQFQNWLGVAPPRPPVEENEKTPLLFNSAQSVAAIID